MKSFQQEGIPNYNLIVNFSQTGIAIPAPTGGNSSRAAIVITDVLSFSQGTLTENTTSGPIITYVYPGWSNATSTLKVTDGAAVYTNVPTGTIRYYVERG